MSSARERFVEAMRSIDEHACDRSMEAAIWERMRQAVEAFADAECNPKLMENARFHYEFDHAACRAALLRECGLED